MTVWGTELCQSRTACTTYTTFHTTYTTFYILYYIYYIPYYTYYIPYYKYYSESLLPSEGVWKSPSSNHYYFRWTITWELLRGGILLADTEAGGYMANTFINWCRRSNASDTQNFTNKSLIRTCHSVVQFQASFIVTQPINIRGQK